MKSSIVIGIVLLALTGTSHAATKCSFNTTTGTLAFGNLDPGIGADVTVSSSISFRCVGSDPVVFSLTDDDGLYESGPNLNRMRNAAAATEFLPYNFFLTPVAGTVPKNTNTNITITGTVKGIDYQKAYVGSYGDTVTLTIAP